MTKTDKQTLKSKVDTPLVQSSNTVQNVSVPTPIPALAHTSVSTLDDQEATILVSDQAASAAQTMEDTTDLSDDQMRQTEEKNQLTHGHL